MTEFRNGKGWRIGIGLALWLTHAVWANGQQATPDFTGVYLIEKPAYELKPSDGSPLPLTEWAKKELAQNKAKLRKKDYSFDLTRERCASPGAARMMTLNYPIEFFQRPYQLTLLFEFNHLYRLINLSEKPRVAPYPMAIGISNGHWEGDTLVVETTDMTDNTLLDSSGLPHSDQLKLSERFRLLDGGNRLEVVMTLEDTKAFTRSWSTTLTYKKTAASGIEEDVCLDRVENGQPALNEASEDGSK